MFGRALALISIVGALGAYNLKADDVYGNLNNGPGKTLVVDGHDLWVWGSIQNSGTVYLLDTLWAQHDLQNSGLIEVLGDKCSGSQSLKNGATGVIKGYGLIVSEGGCIDNQGLVWSLGGSLLLYSVDDPKKVGISNTGTLKSNPGTSITVRVPVPNVSNQGDIEINADGGVVFDCNLTNEPNAVIKLLGGTLAAKTVTQRVGATLDGFGGITGNMVIDPNAIVRLTGPTNIVGDVKIARGATLEISDGTALVTGKVACDGTIHLKGGHLVPQGGLSGDYHIIKEPSTCVIED
jgi:hypothetical protein